MPKNLGTSVLPGSALPLHLIHTRVAPIASDQVLRVALRLESRLGDEAVLTRAMNLGQQAPKNRRYLTSDTLASEIGPSLEAVRAVETFCQHYGFTIEQRAFGGLFLTVEGKSGDLARAFGVELASYKVEDQIVRAYEGSLTLPATLAPYVRAVLGLDDISRLSTGSSSDLDLISTPSLENNLPTTVAFDYYQYPKNVTGQGVIVAFIEENLNVSVENIEEYFAWLGIGSVTIVLAEPVIQPPGPMDSGLRPLKSPYNGEAMMDLKLVGAVAPGATLVAYGTNFDYGFSSDPWIDALLAAILNQNYPCNVMSISLGGPESNWTEQATSSINMTFAIAGLCGITVCIASGDFGATGAPSGKYQQNCAFPASSPFCLACGGTELLLENRNGKRVLTGEIVWNGITAQKPKAASGGGISMVFPVPAFQSALTLSPGFNEDQGPGRGVPDVASNASGLSGYALFPGATGDGCGTSAAAPMWAALIALLIEDNSGTPIGYLNPLLYALQLEGKSCCTPIVVGDNGPPMSLISFQAGAPWNACCGLGSPLGSNLAAAIKKSASS